MDVSSCCGFLPVPAEAMIGRLNPFNQAQQVQLRAQIIVYGSILRDQVPEETLMSLCFADISQGASVEDFHEDNLRRNAWEKIWQAALQAKPSKGKTALPPAPAPPGAKARGPKPGKRKAVKASNQQMAKKKNVKQKNISELDSDVVVVQQVITDTAETQSNSDDEEEGTGLEQLAASAIKAMSDLPMFGSIKKKEEEAHGRLSDDLKSADNTSKDPGDLTDDKAESMETDDTETSKVQRMEETLKRQWKEFVQGALVEVISDEDGLHGAWFSGKIRTVRKNKVQVVYDDLLQDDGGTMLQEWVSIYDMMNSAPRIRLAHPVSSASLPLKGNKFSVGAHVDAWMNDAWWEGIVERINTDNRKQVTLFFPGEGDIGVAKLSDLRRSVVWRDGNWVYWDLYEQGLDSRVFPVAPAQKPPVILDGKRKRERPKRLADGLDDHQPPRKAYTRRTSTRTSNKANDGSIKRRG